MSHRILVADDEAHIRRALCFKLEHRGYEVRSVNSGREAIDALASFTPDLIITDFRMPGEMNGMDVIRAVRNLPAFCETPIILLTGSVAVQDKLVEELGDVQRVKILGKPFSPRELVQTIEEQFV